MMSIQYYFLQATPTLGVRPTTQSTSEKVIPKDANDAQPTSTGSYMQLFFPVVLIAVLYFLLIRPQQRKEKEKKEMIKKVKKGDKVVTRGGIWGVITGFRDNNEICTVKIADKVNIDLSVSAIEMVNPINKKVEKK